MNNPRLLTRKREAYPKWEATYYFLKGGGEGLLLKNVHAIVEKEKP